MRNSSEILDGPEYFLCEKTKCKLRIAVCIQRQEINKKERFFTETPFMVCEDCAQGIRNRNLQQKGDLKLSEVTKDNRLAPENEKREPEKTADAKPARLCECGKPTISPGTPLCPSCMAKRAQKKRQAKPREKASLPLSPTAVIVDFKNHLDILEQVTREAKEQVRTVSGQIIWTLKSAPSQMEGGSRHEKNL